MDNQNVFWTILGIVTITVSCCITYFAVVDSNNSKEIVSRAIERGIDPVVAACAAQVTTGNQSVRSTCEKVQIIKGK